MSHLLQNEFPAPEIKHTDAAMLASKRAVVLYHTGPSLCSQKVRMTLREKGVEWSDCEVNLMRLENLNPEYMRINPRGVVPTLVDGDETIFDSATIMHYIDLSFPGPKLIPADPQAAAEMERWMKLQDEFDMRELSYGNAKGFMGKMLRKKTCKRIGVLKRLAEQNPNLAEEYAVKLRDTEQWIRDQDNEHSVDETNSNMTALLTELDSHLANHHWITGASYSLADIAWSTLLARVEFVGLDTIWQGGKLPNLQNYYARLKERPSFQSEITAFQKRPAILKRVLTALLLGENTDGAICKATI